MKNQRSFSLELKRRVIFVYLAAILDACSRRVIGYAVSASPEAVLTLEEYLVRVD